MKSRLIRAVAGAVFAFLSVSSAAVADGGESNSEKILGSKLHPFSACHMAVGAGISYARLAASDEWTGIGNGTGSGSLPLAADGALVQMGIGCDMHFGRAVVGGFANYNFGDVSTRVGDTTIDVTRNWTIGARLGYMFRPEWMMYTSVGLSYAHAEFQWDAAELDKSMKGARLALGTEYRIAAPVWLRLEGAGTRFEKIDLGEISINPTVYTATASVIFKF